eukprot:m.5605 g.5605  ORF g.5605 m.5605 type:complete len:309 (+) comp2019_c0_seq1:39-965(+)
MQNNTEPKASQNVSSSSSSFAAGPPLVLPAGPATSAAASSTASSARGPGSSDVVLASEVPSRIYVSDSSLAAPASAEVTSTDSTAWLAGPLDTAPSPGRLKAALAGELETASSPGRLDTVSAGTLERADPVGTAAGASESPAADGVDASVLPGSVSVDGFGDSASSAAPSTGSGGTSLGGSGCFFSVLEENQLLKKPPVSGVFAGAGGGGGGASKTGSTNSTSTGASRSVGGLKWSASAGVSRATAAWVSGNATRFAMPIAISMCSVMTAERTSTRFFSPSRRSLTTSGRTSSCVREHRLLKVSIARR